MAGRPDPSDDELLAFVNATLADLDRELRKPVVVAQAISDSRDLWVMLYHVSRELDDLTEDLNESSG